MTPTGTRTLLRSPQVCRVTGASYRQLDYWLRRGVLRSEAEAHGSGTQRLFTVEQAVVVRACFVLSHYGAGTEAMGGLARAIERDPGWLAQRVVVDDEGDVFAALAPIDGWVIDLAACAEWVEGYLSLR